MPYMKVFLIFWQSSVISWGKYYLYVRKWKQREVWKFAQDHVSHMWWEQKLRSWIHSFLLLLLSGIASMGEERFGRYFICNWEWFKRSELGSDPSRNCQISICLATARGERVQRRGGGKQRKIRRGVQVCLSDQIPRESSFSLWMESRSKSP